MKISVLTPTMRPEGLEMVKKSLDNQTFRDFEWLVGSRFKPQYGEWIHDTFFGGIQRKDGTFYTLNRIYNELIRQSEGELIVSWQDYIYAPPDTLQRLYDLYQYDDHMLITCVGDQYDKVDEHGKPYHKVWDDIRKGWSKQTGETFYEVNPDDWEIALASAPKKMFYDIGGFDEGMEIEYGVGCDNVSVGERADECGYKVWIAQSIEYFAYCHERDKLTVTNHANQGGYWKRKEELKRMRKWPVLNYLTQ